MHFLVHQLFFQYLGGSNILYLNTIGFKAQSLWGRVQIKLIKSNLIKLMQVFEERGKPEYLGKNLSEQRREPTNSTCI